MKKKFLIFSLLLSINTLSVSEARIYLLGEGGPFRSPASETADSQFGLEFIPGSSKKVCQLIGDVDDQLDTPTLNETFKRAAVEGSDLGFSFEHKGKLFFLFGDTQNAKKVERLRDEDSIASAVMVKRPDECIELDFIKDRKDGGYHPPKIPGVSNSSWEVPSGGVSANGKMYVYFTTGHSKEKVMGRSVLGVSSDDGYSFKKAYDFSSNHFINTAPVKIDDEVLIFGSGEYRKSDPYLAKTTEKGLKHKNSLRYFSGVDAQENKPMWSENEQDAAPLFDHPCIGELSVSYDQPSAKWMMLYNCYIDQVAAIHMRTADHAWGPWSNAQVIFHPERDQGFCNYLHRKPDAKHPKCDEIADDDDDGSEVYAPFMVPSLSETHGDVRTVYYTMSIWDPYRVLLMKSDFKITR